MKDLITVKQGKATTIKNRSGTCLTEERQILNGWTELCVEVYNHKTNGDPSILNCPHLGKDDHPILRKEAEAAVQSLQKRKIAGVDNIPAQLVKIGGEAVITGLTTICNKTLQIGKRTTRVISHYTFQDKQLAAMPEKPNDQSHQPSKQSRVEGHIEQTEAASREDRHRRTGRLLSRKALQRADLKPKEHV